MKCDWCDRHDSEYDIDEGCEYCYKEYLDKKKLIEEFLKDLKEAGKADMPVHYILEFIRKWEKRCEK